MKNWVKAVWHTLEGPIFLCLIAGGMIFTFWLTYVFPTFMLGLMLTIIAVVVLVAWWLAIVKEKHRLDREQEIQQRFPTPTKDKDFEDYAYVCKRPDLGPYGD